MTKSRSNRKKAKGPQELSSAAPTGRIAGGFCSQDRLKKPATGSGRQRQSAEQSKPNENEMIGNDMKNLTTEDTENTERENDLQCELAAWELLCEARRERDEARESLKHIAEYGTEEINASVELRQKLAHALVDLDNMQYQRDLAMKVISRLERERDEAREAFKEMWRSGDAFLPHVDSETINRWRKAAGWEGAK